MVFEDEDTGNSITYWKFNNSLVEDIYFLNLLKNEISCFSREVPDPSDLIVKWEYK